MCSPGLTLFWPAPIFFSSMASASHFGEHLRREREMRGVSLEELSSATRISTKFLTAIESGHWDQLPGGAFNRGYIRSASRYLGLDEDGMVAEYSLEANHGMSETMPMQVAARRISHRWKIVAGATGVVVLLICLILAGRFVPSRIRARSHAQPFPPTAPAISGKDAPLSPAASAAAPLHLVVRASSAVHVRVIADGKGVFDGEIEAGRGKEFSARETFQVATRNSAAVRLELNGQPIPPFGVPGRPGGITLTAKDAKPSAGGVH
ncbi:MAG TPA: RodZ domain-containing protein [Candidatus Acidoferrales bacterium]|nr:RodZ domain-containing protein [Candidatus Acidoferrales bacterium]